jgi:hypothetical protein
VRVRLLANVDKSLQGKTGTVEADSAPGEVVLVSFHDGAIRQQLLAADLEPIDGTEKQNPDQDTRRQLQERFDRADAAVETYLKEYGQTGPEYKRLHAKRYAAFDALLREPKRNSNS